MRDVRYGGGRWPPWAEGWEGVLEAWPSTPRSAAPARMMLGSYTEGANERLPQRMAQPWDCGSVWGFGWEISAPPETSGEGDNPSRTPGPLPMAQALLSSACPRLGEGHQLLLLQQFTEPTGFFPLDHFQKAFPPLTHEQPLPSKR